MTGVGAGSTVGVSLTAQHLTILGLPLSMRNGEMLHLL